MSCLLFTSTTYTTHNPFPTLTSLQFTHFIFFSHAFLSLNIIYFITQNYFYKFSNSLHSLPLMWLAPLPPFPPHFIYFYLFLFNQTNPKCLLYKYPFIISLLHFYFLSFSLLEKTHKSSLPLLSLPWHTHTHTHTHTISFSSFILLLKPF